MSLRSDETNYNVNARIRAMCAICTVCYLFTYPILTKHWPFRGHWSGCLQLQGSPNIKQIIDGHNKNLWRQNTPPEGKTPSKPCNCRQPDQCPLKGQCLVKEVVYQATITTQESSETYVGLTATDFKTRWRNHEMSFKHEKRRNDTELSKYVWQLKDQKKNFTLSWKVLTKAKVYTNLTKRCNLCNTEKFLHST